MVTEVALAVVQLSVLNWPAEIVAGEAESVALVPFAVGVGVGVGEGEITPEAAPAHPAMKVLTVANNRLAIPTRN